MKSAGKNLWALVIQTHTVLQNNNNINNSKMSQQHYRNPPNHQNSMQHVQNTQHPQQLQQGHPRSHSGVPASSHKRSLGGSSGPQQQVRSPLVTQQAFEENYSDIAGAERLSPNPQSQQLYQQPPHRSSFGYQPQQQQESSPYQRHPPYQQQRPYLENSSHSKKQQPAVSVGLPLQHAKAQHSSPSHQLSDSGSSIPSQHRVSQASASGIPKHRERAPSPAHSTHSVHSNHSNDMQPAVGINRSRSPGGFYQAVTSPSVPSVSHSRQGSNASQVSNLSSASRTMQTPYQPQLQQQQQQHSTLPVPNSYLPPPPPSLTTAQGGNDRFSPSLPQAYYPHQSPTAASSHDFRYVDDIDPPPPPLPPPYAEEAAYHSPGGLARGASPPLTPPTPPIVMTGNLEDEFTRVSYVCPIFYYFRFCFIFLLLLLIVIGNFFLLLLLLFVLPGCDARLPMLYRASLSVQCLIQIS